MCIDYRNLNSITTKDKYPVSNIDDLLEKLRGAKYFTRLDIISAYYMIRVASGHEWKTVFRTPDGCFELLVMPFGLANSPPTWQAFIGNIIRNIADGIVTYVDHLLIYANIKGQLYSSTVQVLQKLKKNNLFCKISKCAFGLVDSHRRNKRYFVTYVRRVLFRSLTVHHSQWNPNLRGILETDASGGGISGILSQIDEGVQKPVVFWSRKLHPEEINHGTLDQELLAVVDALLLFRVYPEGAQHKVKVYGDHANLRYFKSTVRPTRRQAGYIKKLASLGFDIFHFPGTKTSADGPSRRPDDMGKPNEAEKDWGLSFKDDENQSIQINAIVLHEFQNIMTEALENAHFVK
ncbi:hypothetical protein K3495_g6801 [Podosphaera aphanis]|nr:hypothetical protein K3495_g6801 [Podosphaera aphanis]